MAPSRSTFNCPRCGESLPGGIDRCDACGGYIVPSPSPATRPGQTGPRADRRGGPHAAPARMTSFAWLMLVVGLGVGGAVGYALRSGSGIGEPGAATAGGGGMGGAGPMAGQGMPTGGMGMPPEVLQMLQQYRAKLAQDPNDVEANVGLGNLEFDSAHWGRAVGHYEKALEARPGDADVRIDMAIALHNLGDDARARKEMERVTREQPGHVNAWFNLGVVAGSMGDKKTAIRAWEQYLKLDPSGERSAGIREELRRLKGTL